MKLGVFDPVFASLTLDEMLDKLVTAGLEAVEIGVGGYPGSVHCPVEELLASETARAEYMKKFEDRGIIISAFSCHGNPIGPDKEFAASSDKALRDGIKLAQLLNVPVVNCFSGIPGATDNDAQPNWPTVAWPTEFADIYDWQWETKLIPYWKEIAAIADAAGVKIGIELHGGFMVHSPYTMLKLREATSDAIGANFDPSHMWWQGIDPVAAIKILGEAGAIHHFHAKDVVMDQDNMNMHGVLDMQPYGNYKTRAWYFRSVGCGHDMKVWSDMISALRVYGYDYVVSIEHEDGLMSIEEGFMRAVTNLKTVLINEPAAEAWWEN